MLARRVREKLAEGSPIRRAFEEGERQAKIYGRENVFDLSIGNPGAETPKSIREAMLSISGENPHLLHSYMSDAGFLDVREAIAKDLEKRVRSGEFFLKEERETKGKKDSFIFSSENILMSHGAAGAMNVLLYAILDPGDEVIVFKPYFPGYRSFIENYYGKMVEVDCHEEDFQIDFEDLERKINEKTKVIIVNSPNNPSGCIYSLSSIQRLAETLKKKEQEFGHSILLLSDEPYRDLCFDKEKLPFIPSFYQNTVIAYSYSKSLSIPGERIGYLLIPDSVEGGKELMQGARNATGSLGYVNANAFFQKVVKECLKEKAPVEFYEKNREILYQSLLRFGFSVVEPKGAFYIFLKVPKRPEETFLKLEECREISKTENDKTGLYDEIEFLERGKAQHIMMVGGAAFGMPGYVRVSFCGRRETIENSLSAFRRLAQSYNLVKATI